MGSTALVQFGERSKQTIHQNAYVSLTAFLLIISGQPLSLQN